MNDEPDEFFKACTDALLLFPHENSCKLLYDRVLQHNNWNMSRLQWGLIKKTQFENALSVGSLEFI